MVKMQSRSLPKRKAVICNDTILQKLILYWNIPCSLCAHCRRADRFLLVAFGVTLVLKRFSFIGMTFSCGVRAMAIAAAANHNEMPLVMVITIVSAVLLLRTGRTRRSRRCRVAMISVARWPSAIC